MSLERIVEINPAYDKRPKYGIHGVEMRFMVKGPKGVIQFLLFTNWHVEKVQKELDAKYADHLLCHPSPADLGYHSYVPRYEGQESMGPCTYLDNVPCYYDGSGLNAEPVYWTMVNEGGEAMWKALEAEYELRFAEDKVTSGTPNQS